MYHEYTKGSSRPAANKTQANWNLTRTEGYIEIKVRVIVLVYNWLTAV